MPGPSWRSAIPTERDRPVDWDALILVGIIARPQGHQGDVIVNAETDFPEERFAPGARLFMRRADRVVPVIVRDSRMHLERPVIRLEGVETMNDAEALRGAELRVPEQDLHPLPEGRYYRHQLLDCEVVTVEGRLVGVVEGFDGADADRLAVRGPAGEVLVPLVEPIVVAIDIAARRIVIDPPEGLLELNAPER